MTKLEKIEEILREYDNGVDASIDALDILEGIKNVMNDPCFPENNIKDNDNILRIKTSAGELCAFVGTDEFNPSVGIYLMPEGGDGSIIDLAYAEVKGDECREKDEGEQDVSLYTFADPWTEDYTAKNIIKRADVVKALELDIIDYKEISNGISKLQTSLSDEKFRKETPWISEEKCSVISYNASEGDGMSHFRIDLKEGSIDVSTGSNGYILTDAGKGGEYMKEEVLFAVAKAVKDATQKECYPRSGVEAWSWKGVLTAEHITELENMGKPEKKIKEKEKAYGIEK